MISSTDDTRDTSFALAFAVLKFRNYESIVAKGREKITLRLPCDRIVYHVLGGEVSAVICGLMTNVLLPTRPN